MPYSAPDLPYANNALEPKFARATMRLHHDKHHQAYVDKANGAVEGTEWADRPVEEVLANLSSLPSDQQGVSVPNGGGHANHTLFWESMSPGAGGGPVARTLFLEMMSPGGGGEPTGDLFAAISSAFGSFTHEPPLFWTTGV